MFISSFGFDFLDQGLYDLDLFLNILAVFLLCMIGSAFESAALLFKQTNFIDGLFHHFYQAATGASAAGATATNRFPSGDEWRRALSHWERAAADGRRVRVSGSTDPIEQVILRRGSTHKFELRCMPCRRTKTMKRLFRRCSHARKRRAASLHRNNSQLWFVPALHANCWSAILSWTLSNAHGRVISGIRHQQVLTVFFDVLSLFCLRFRCPAALAAENLFLRKQLSLYVEREKKPRRASDSIRFTLARVSRLFRWLDVLVIVKPDTLIRWHRKGFRLFWKWKSRPCGRPRVPLDLRKYGFGLDHEQCRTPTGPQSGQPNPQASVACFEDRAFSFLGALEHDQLMAKRDVFGLQCSLAPKASPKGTERP
jgi:hypothetical protein